MLFRLHRLAGAVAMAAAGLLAAPAAPGRVYSSTVPIFITRTSVGSPYPSTIQVTGGPASIQGIKVTLTNFPGVYIPECSVLLVTPTGRAIELMDRPCGSNLTDQTYTFSSASGSPALPCPPVGGTYAPSGGNSAFNGPAPAGPYLGAFAPLDGTDANGVWSLYVQNFAQGSSPPALTVDGWSLEFGPFGFPPVAASPTAFTYQGRLTGSGPQTGTIDARFTLWDHPVVPAAGNRVAGPATVTNIPLSGGLFTATVDFGLTVPTDRQTWLGIEVANPSGAGFVSLSPRQAMTLAPLANSPGYSITPAALQDTPGNLGVKAVMGNLNTGSSDFCGIRSVVNTNDSCGNKGELLFYTWEHRCAFLSAHEAMRIDGLGRVGIGTSTPTQSLHVIGNILASGTITPSSARLKENVVPMRDALERLAGLDAVRFDWTPDEARVRGFAHDLGFIAEDVAGVFPEVAFHDDHGGVIGLDYSRMSAVAVAAIKQLKAENDRIRADNAELRSRLEKIEAMLGAKAAPASK
jgi:hypothetical protein